MIAHRLADDGAVIGMHEGFRAAFIAAFGAVVAEHQTELR
jgi:hypothetical protein